LEGRGVGSTHLRDLVRKRDLIELFRLHADVFDAYRIKNIDYTRVSLC
jgi:hypothetical protein